MTKGPQFYFFAPGFQNVRTDPGCTTPCPLSSASGDSKYLNLTKKINKVDEVLNLLLIHTTFFHKKFSYNFIFFKEKKYKTLKKYEDLHNKKEKRERTYLFKINSKNFERNQTSNLF